MLSMCGEVQAPEPDPSADLRAGQLGDPEAWVLDDAEWTLAGSMTAVWAILYDERTGEAWCVDLQRLEDEPTITLGAD